MSQMHPNKKLHSQQQPFLGIELSLQETGKLNNVVNTILDYEALASIDLNHQIYSLKKLSTQILSQFYQLKERPLRLKQHIQLNAEFIHSILNHTKPLKYANTEYYYPASKLLKIPILAMQQWSSEGKEHRKYIASIKQLLKKHTQSKSILIAGGYLGRLIYELSSDYEINANEEEFDYFLILNYFLNASNSVFKIYPYIHNFCNHLNQNHVFKQVRVPDVEIWKGKEQNIGVSLGSFDRIYRYQNGIWQCIVFHFVLQRGNPVKLLQRGYNCLRKDGKLIIITTLNYQTSSGFQLSYEQIKETAQTLGFKIVEEKEQVRHIKDQQILVSLVNTLYYLVLQKN